MKPLFNILSSIFISYSLFAQNYEIEYNHITTFDAMTTESVYKFVYNGDQSIYYQIDMEFEEHYGNEVIPANEGLVPFVEKNYQNKSVVYNQPLINKIKLIRDDLPIQTWKLENKTKKIKSFICKKATTTFRGRSYTAWYTEKMPIIGGPWKFDGLPGLILAVSSDDGVLNIEAVKIEKKDAIKFPKFEYEQDQLITWDEYCKKFQEVIERIKKSFQADTDPDVEYDLDINLVEIIETE